jgi:hypothetical protein
MAQLADAAHRRILKRESFIPRSSHSPGGEVPEGRLSKGRVIANDLLEQLPAPCQVGKTRVGGIDLNKPRMRWVGEAVIALSASPGGFTASQSKQKASAYGVLRAAYDLKKLRGKDIVRRIGRTRGYEVIPSGLKALTALVVLRNKATIKPLLAAAQELRPARHAQNPRPLDKHYQDLRTAMQGVFHELGIAA